MPRKLETLLPETTLLGGERFLSEDQRIALARNISAGIYDDEEVVRRYIWVNYSEGSWPTSTWELFKLGDNLAAVAILGKFLSGDRMPGPRIRMSRDA